MLVSIDGTDITKYILASSYEINSVPEYDSWKDANYINHRDIHRYRVQGQFEMKFPADGGVAYEEFIDLLNEKTASGAAIFTVFVNNRNALQTIEAFCEFYPVMMRNAHGKSFEKVKFVLEEC